MIFDIDPLSDARWSKLVDVHPSASPFHSAGWLRALSATYGYRPAALTTSKPNEEVINGLVYCDVASWLTGRRLLSLAFSDHCAPLAATPGDLAALVEAFEQRVAGVRCRYGEIRFVGEPCAEATMAEKFYHHVIDLRAGADAAFSRFHKDCVQRKIRRSEREGVVVARDDDVDVFYRLQLLTRRRHELPPQPIAWFRNVMRHLRGSATIWVARHHGEPIAAIFVLRHGRTLYYKYGASDERFHRFGAMPLLFWRLVEHGVESGGENIDLGRSDLDDQGLITFKEHLGAVRSTLSYCRFPAQATVADRRQAMPMRLVQKACAIAPDRCLTMLGAILYRHSA